MITTTPPPSDAIAKHTRRFHGDDGSQRITALRAEFEEWYVVNAFDYARDPIGSDVCDMQWRGWKGAREIAAQPGEGGEFVLVPNRFHVDADAWEAITFSIGGPSTGEGEQYMDSTLWIGEIEQDDGSKLYGLHVSCNECPEEGSITLATFERKTSPPHVADALDGELLTDCVKALTVLATMLRAHKLRDGAATAEDMLGRVKAAIAARAEAGGES